MAAGGVSVRTFNFNCNFFERHWVIVNLRKDVAHFHQKNCRRSKVMLQEVKRQKFFYSGKEYGLLSYIETISDMYLLQLFVIM